MALICKRKYKLRIKKWGGFKRLQQQRIKNCSTIVTLTFKRFQELRAGKVVEWFLNFGTQIKVFTKFIKVFFS